MSRLDSFIRRLTAQRACLNEAASLIAGREGVVLEIGLGNGRTFDHLRALMPDREIFVFDRQVAAHPDSVPDDQYLILGEIPESLATAAERLTEKAVLVHSDIGTGNALADARVARRMAEILPNLMLPGALLLSDQNIPLPNATMLPLPDGVPDERYFFRTWNAPEAAGKRTAVRR